MTTQIMPLDFHVDRNGIPVILPDSLEHLEGEAQSDDEWAQWLRDHRRLTEVEVAERAAERARDHWTPAERMPGQVSLR